MRTIKCKGTNYRGHARGPGAGSDMVICLLVSDHCAISIPFDVIIQTPDPDEPDTHVPIKYHWCIHDCLPTWSNSQNLIRDDIATKY